MLLAFSKLYFMLLKVDKILTFMKKIKQFITILYHKQLLQENRENKEILMESVGMGH